MTAINRQKTPNHFVCEPCDFSCSKSSDNERHILTRKHETRTKLNGLEQELHPNPTLHICKTCKKEYKARNSLWYHAKTCTPVDTTPTENMIVLQIEEHPEHPSEVSVLTSLVMEIVKSNFELQRQSTEAQKQSVEAQRQMVETQKQFLDVCKNLQPSLNNNCHNTNNTNTFNMQVFLNEECKNAINLSDFVNSFEVQLEDLENVGKLGYATGISNMIIKELKLLDVYKRPIHCSDPRREIFYVKENNIWERETPDNSNVKKAIQGVTRKNMTKLNDWRDKYPECMDSESAYNDIYLKLVHESCGGRGDAATNDQKIFKNIMKEVLIKK
jgi:hypothetical protein